MKIYLLKKCSGEYEDYYESIVLCTSNKSKAENTKKKLEQEAKNKDDQYFKCCQCPIICATNKRQYDKAKKDIDYYCDNFKELIEADGETSCENEVYILGDTFYKIEELECVE